MITKHGWRKCLFRHTIMYFANECNVDTPPWQSHTFLFPTLQIISVLGGYSMLYSQATSGADKTS